MKMMVSLMLCVLLLSSCSIDKEVMIQESSEVVLTKMNELQIRFTFNETFLPKQDVYKVKISIENKQLREALGITEIYYGEESTHLGKALVGEARDEVYLSMDPLPLKQDLHTFELEELIQQKQAVKIEIYQNEQVVASSYITNFVSQL